MSVIFDYKEIRSLEPEPAKPVGYTAAEVIERYGDAVLTLYYGKNYRLTITDLNGFAYTGRLEKTKRDDWYLESNNIKYGVARQETIGRSSGTYLTLIKLPQPTPRIINYLKREAASFLDDEAAYLPNEKGEMFAVDRNEVAEEYFWERQEVA